tara:strand:- start:623 stop:793 length:171 start_codon:yes stop_codon:yes gene_type:complete
MKNKFEMEIQMNNDIEILYTTIPEITDINYILNELSEIENFNLNEITEIKIYPLKK